MSKSATIHIVRAAQPSAAQIDWLLPRLDADESERLSRLTRDQVRNQFLCSRYWLHYWLNEHWQIEHVALQRNSAGKPRLIDSSLEFSLSHTSDWVVVAVAEHPVGVDIELSNRVSTRHLKWFSDSEQLACQQGLVSPIQLWTIKEAMVKQQGSTLAKELGQTSIDWSVWRQSKMIMSKVWQKDWCVSAYSPDVEQWLIKEEGCES